MRLRINFDIQEVDDSGFALRSVASGQEATCEIPEEVFGLLTRLEAMKDELDGAMGVTASQLATAQADYAKARALVAHYFDTAGASVAGIALLRARTFYAEPEPEPETMGAVAHGGG